MDVKLREIGFWIALSALIVSFVGMFSAAAQVVLFPATILTGGTAVLLFLRIIFSRTYRRGIDAINREMQGNDPWPGRRKKLSDPDGACSAAARALSRCSGCAPYWFSESCQSHFYKN